METNLKLYYGIHPGIILARELRKRRIKKRPFALGIDEHPQTLNAITKGNRKMTVAQALKIETALDLPEGTLVLLQAYYDIFLEKEKNENPTPNLELLRPALFWDTELAKIDWHKKHKAVINRVFERGNTDEQNEIIRFYGQAKVNKVLREEVLL